MQTPRPLRGPRHSLDRRACCNRPLLVRPFGLLDVAMTYPLRSDAIHLAATEGPTAVATAYVETKYTTYGHLIAPASQHFTPVVFDSFGGMSANASVLLGKIATAFGQRCPEGTRIGRLKFFTTTRQSSLRPRSSLHLCFKPQPSRHQVAGSFPLIIARKYPSF